MKGQDADEVDRDVYFHRGYCYGWVQIEGQTWILHENTFPTQKVQQYYQGFQGRDVDKEHLSCQIS